LKVKNQYPPKNKIEIKSPQESKPEANIDEAIENSYCKSLQRIKTHETTAEMGRTENQWTQPFDRLVSSAKPGKRE